MRFTTLSNSFQYLYKKLEESGEYDLKCSYVQFNFIRGREFTKRVDDMLQELATAKYVFIDDADKGIVMLLYVYREPEYADDVMFVTRFLEIK